MAQSGLVAALVDILGNLKVNEVARERIALLKEQAEALENRITQLEKENSGLRDEVNALKGGQAQPLLAGEFIEHCGAMFKRKTEGGFHRAVYCPKCKQSTAAPIPHLPYHCNCGWWADFKSSELDRIMKDLPA